MYAVSITWKTGGDRGTLLSHYVVKQQYGRELCALLQYGHVRWFM